jgi:WhiB family redox-sensing transcriptional regulator
MSGESADARRARESAAKRICVDCPVQRECLEYALRVREPFGIWGGLDETERRARTGTGTG